MRISDLKVGQQFMYATRAKRDPEGWAEAKVEVIDLDPGLRPRTSDGWRSYDSEKRGVRVRFLDAGRPHTYSVPNPGQERIVYPAQLRQPWAEYEVELAESLARKAAWEKSQAEVREAAEKAAARLRLRLACVPGLDGVGVDVGGQRASIVLTLDNTEASLLAERLEAAEG